MASYTRAYSKLYLDDAMLSMGSMFIYGVHDCKFSLCEVWDMFCDSRYGDMFSTGDPHVVAGMSGVEILQHIDCDIKGVWEHTLPDPQHQLCRDDVYWTGWLMAYYQWFTGQSFQRLHREIDLEWIHGLYYPLHEADIEKAVNEILLRQRLDPIR